MAALIGNKRYLNWPHIQTIKTMSFRTLSGGKIKEIPPRIFIGFPRLQFL